MSNRFCIVKALIDALNKEKDPIPGHCEISRSPVDSSNANQSGNNGRAAAAALIDTVFNSTHCQGQAQLFCFYSFHSHGPGPWWSQ